MQVQTKTTYTQIFLPKGTPALSLGAIVFAALAFIMAMIRFSLYFSEYGGYHDGILFDWASLFILMTAAGTLIVSQVKKGYLFGAVGVFFMSQAFGVITSITRMNWNAPIQNIPSMYFISLFLSVIIAAIYYLLFYLSKLQISDTDQTPTQGYATRILILALIPVVIGYGNIATFIRLFLRGEELGSILSVSLSPSYLLSIALAFAFFDVAPKQLTDPQQITFYQNRQLLWRWISWGLAATFMLTWLYVTPGALTILLLVIVCVGLLSWVFSFLVAKIGIGGVKGGLIGGILFGWVGAIIGGILGSKK
ncbi:MAG: hypothetical protein ACOX7F_04690 [Eubacteriales bacterium]|jgi:hypothetical protein